MLVTESSTTRSSCRRASRTPRTGAWPFRNPPCRSASHRRSSTPSRPIRFHGRSRGPLHRPSPHPCTSPPPGGPRPDDGGRRRTSLEVRCSSVRPHGPRPLGEGFWRRYGSSPLPGSPPPGSWRR